MHQQLLTKPSCTKIQQSFYNLQQLSTNNKPKISLAAPLIPVLLANKYYEIYPKMKDWARSRTNAILRLDSKCWNPKDRAQELDLLLQIITTQGTVKPLTQYQYTKKLNNKHGLELQTILQEKLHRLRNQRIKILNFQNIKETVCPIQQTVSPQKNFAKINNSKANNQTQEILKQKGCNLDSPSSGIYQLLLKCSNSKSLVMQKNQVLKNVIQQKITFKEGLQSLNGTKDQGNPYERRNQASLQNCHDKQSLTYSYQQVFLISYKESLDLWAKKMIKKQDTKSIYCQFKYKTYNWLLQKLALKRIVIALQSKQSVNQNICKPNREHEDQLHKKSITIISQLFIKNVSGDSVELDLGQLLRKKQNQNGQTISIRNEHQQPRKGSIRFIQDRGRYITKIQRRAIKIINSTNSLLSYFIGKGLTHYLDSQNYEQSELAVRYVWFIGFKPRSMGETKPLFHQASICQRTDSCQSIRN